MEKSKKEALTALVGGLLFAVLFWEEGFGLNALLFSLMSLAACYLADKNAFARTETKTFFGLHFLSVFLYLATGGNGAFLLYWVSWAGSLAFAKSDQTRSLFFGLLGTFTNLFVTLKPLAGLFSAGEKEFSGQRVFYIIRITVLPTVLLMVFYGIYANSVAAFGEVGDRFFGFLSEMIEQAFGFASVSWMLVSCLGILLFALPAMPWTSHWAVQIETGLSELLTRAGLRKELSAVKNRRISAVDLKIDFLSGMLLLAFINAMLFLVNAAAFYELLSEQSAPLLMAGKLHEEAFSLIGSIGLSLMVLLYFFRGNQNFYPKSSMSKKLALLWILQNGLLAAIVFSRNAQYINELGLTYKRSGVFVFLALALSGLLTFAVKIHQNKSFYYLLKTNGWAALGVLLICSTFNWGREVVKHNLQKEKGSTDYALLYQVGDDGLDLLLEDYQDKTARETHLLCADPYYAERLEYLKTTFLEKEEGRSWLSWNYTAYRIGKAL